MKLVSALKSLGIWLAWVTGFGVWVASVTLACNIITNGQPLVGLVIMATLFWLVWHFILQPVGQRMREEDGQ